MELAYAGLHQLCAPMLDRMHVLAGPQRDALATAFGLVAGKPPDRFLVGLAVLGLLADVAEANPLMCVLDDAQWLDRVSLQTLAFVARRLLAEHVALVFALRGTDDEHTLAGLPELAVVGLNDADARVLLESTIPGPLDSRVRARILAEARGNPLALLELPRGATRPPPWQAGSGCPASAASHSHRAGLCQAVRTAPGRDAATPARGGSRTRGRRCLAVARGRSAQDRTRCDGTG